MSILGFWQGTRVIFPENAIPMAGNNLICEISQGTWHDREARRQNSPEATQLTKNTDRSGGPGEHLLARLTKIGYKTHTLQGHAISPVFFQELASKFTLQRGKSEAIAPIPLQDELHHPIAESAYSIVENDRVGSPAHVGKLLYSLWLCT